MTQAAAYNRSVDDASMPDRIRRLPISPKGFPVPWFVAWFDESGKHCEDGKGVPDFRVVNSPKVKMAMDRHLCFTCGEPMGAYKCFTIGPMCCISRTISEPPSHRDCAIFSARFCPFLSKPKAARNAKGMYDEHGKPVFQEAAGIAILRNPGAVCVWVTKTYQPFRPPGGGMLFSLGRPTEVLWFAEGRKATRAEVMASIDSGYPLLEDAARMEGHEALQALATQRSVAMALVPA